MDLKIRIEDNSYGDIKFEENDAELDYGLTNAVLISLFTDRRATNDDAIPDGTENRRGWWGDTISNFGDEDQIGSRLWLLDRSKVTNEILNAAEEYAKESLDWMLDDGIAAAIEVEAEKYKFAADGNYALGLTIEILKNDGSTFTMKFNDLWTGQFETNEGGS